MNDELRALNLEANQAVGNLSYRDWLLTRYYVYLERANGWANSSSSLAPQWMADDMAEARKYRDKLRAGETQHPQPGDAIAAQETTA